MDSTQTLQAIALLMCFSGVLMTLCLALAFFLIPFALLLGDSIRPGAICGLLGMLLFFPGLFFLFIPVAVPHFASLHGATSMQLHLGGLVLMVTGVWVAWRYSGGVQMSA